ncbi:hypothetical protein E4U43_002514 [Claviceps pusilla]|uniref:Uncharacterized protein n=1 Tax=Claviceps pusilla TaxID=123648 RepID=A0A9P7N8R2_9HYPO|nr:hypothetical protein E4U43_002514 [Claviceps pusilla]
MGIPGIQLQKQADEVAAEPGHSSLRANLDAAPMSSAASVRYALKSCGDNEETSQVRTSVARRVHVHVSKSDST